MNTFSIVVSILMPLMVVGYIVGDWLSRRPVKNHQITYDPKINEIIYDSRENEGERLSQEEILGNTSYLLNHYAEILSK